VLLDPAVWVPPPRALVEAERERADRSFASREEALAVRARTSRRAGAGVIENDLDLHLVHSDDGRYRYRYCQSAVVTAFAEMAKRPPLDRVRVPVLLVRAPEAGIVPDALVDSCRELLRDLEVVDVPGGHIVMWDAFEETADAIERFVR
jgi:lipase